jgi:hypothetical protein
MYRRLRKAEIQSLNAVLGSADAILKVAFMTINDNARQRRAIMRGLKRQGNMGRRQLNGKLHSLEASDQQLIGKIHGVNEILCSMSQAYDLRQLKMTARLMNGWGALDFNMLSKRQRDAIGQEMGDPGYVG